MRPVRPVSSRGGVRGASGLSGWRRRTRSGAGSRRARPARIAHLGRAARPGRDRVLVGEDIACNHEGFQVCRHLEPPSRRTRLEALLRACVAGPCAGPAFSHQASSCGQRLDGVFRRPMFCLVGAPGFEPGTSSPQAYSVEWRAMVECGGTWPASRRKYHRSDTFSRSLRRSVFGRFGPLWAPSPARILIWV
jgi:hypothetical protein